MESKAVAGKKHGIAATGDAATTGTDGDVARSNKGKEPVRGNGQHTVIDGVDDVDDDDESLDRRRKKKRSRSSQLEDGLFLETVDRSRLDFDFEKLCSVSLSNQNVYACLVCGKYFQGRGPGTHAYIHSLQEDHHVYINLETLKVYILPDGNEVKDSSLNDIKYVLFPTFSNEQITAIDKATTYSYDLNNKPYLPGFVGMNNIKANDYINVVIQTLSHIPRLRDFFLAQEPSTSSELAKRFGLLTRKIWNSRAFKGQVSPHELLQEISNASQKRFLLTKQADPLDFMVWFLNNLHLGLGGTKKPGSSIIHQIFQGEVTVESQPVLTEQERFLNIKKEITTTTTPFLFLAFELPAQPLFQSDLEKNIIPQVPLTTLLEKYDGVTWKDYGQTLKRMKITKLPKFLIFHMKRFTRNNFTEEKNPTIVNFPINGLDLGEYVDHNVEGSAKYDLLANICHEGGRAGAETGEYKVHVHSKGRDQWFVIQDLFVEEIVPQMIFLSESYIQIWEQVE